MMGLLGDKGKFASTVLGESSEPEEKEVSDGLEADFSSVYEHLAQGINAAIKSGDNKAMAQALRSMIMAVARESDYSKED